MAEKRRSGYLEAAGITDLKGVEVGETQVIILGETDLKRWNFDQLGDTEMAEDDLFPKQDLPSG